MRGHARAIELLYQCLGKPVDEEAIIALHRAVQTEHVDNIYKPIGAWKNESNGTHVVGPENKQQFIEYALPLFVPKLMAEVLTFIKSLQVDDVDLDNAAEVSAKIHMGIAHIHPFWDGNGRIARLLANIPLLKSGLPPLVISQEQRRLYIETLSSYQLNTGPLNSSTGVWPQSGSLNAFNDFCASCYGSTKELVEKAFTVQSGRASSF